MRKGKRRAGLWADLRVTESGGAGWTAFYCPLPVIVSLMTDAELIALYNPDAPLEEAFTIPAPWYLDARMEEMERERVFAHNWIAVGRADQLAAAGQFFTMELAGEPLVVVRGEDGN